MTTAIRHILSLGRSPFLLLVLVVVRDVGVHTVGGTPLQSIVAMQLPSECR